MRQIFAERTRGRISPLGTMTASPQATGIVVTWLAGVLPAGAQASVIVL